MGGEGGGDVRRGKKGEERKERRGENLREKGEEMGDGEEREVAFCLSV